MKKSEFESELSVVDELMKKDIKKKDRKQIVERLQKLMVRVEKHADRGDIPKEAALKIRVDLCRLAKQVKKKNQDGESARKNIHDLVEHIVQIYQSQPKSPRGTNSEDKLMALLFRSFK